MADVTNPHSHGAGSVVVVNSPPNVSGGTAAPIGMIGVYNTSPATLWIKQTASDTGWVTFNTQPQGIYNWTSNAVTSIDVAGVSIINCNTSVSGSLTLNGFTNGVEGQDVFINKTDSSSNLSTLTIVSTSGIGGLQHILTDTDTNIVIGGLLATPRVLLHLKYLSGFWRPVNAG